MAVDGDCLFRSLSDQIYFDNGKRHLKVREEICEYLGEYKELHKFLPANVSDKAEVSRDISDNPDKEVNCSEYESYVKTMREDRERRGQLETKAAAIVYSYVPLLTNFVDV